MTTGGVRRVIMPPDLGYGSDPRTNPQGEVVIPANSTLIFDLELLITN
jgi:FKBP-type peptidyl-prolyl cis-trans isomerase